MGDVGGGGYSHTYLHRMCCSTECPLTVKIMLTGCPFLTKIMRQVDERVMRQGIIIGQKILCQGNMLKETF